MHSELLFTASNDMTFGIHKMNLKDKSLAAVDATLMKVSIDAKPNEIAVSKFVTSGCLYLADVEGVISRFNVKY